METISNIFHQGALAIILVADFFRQSSKTFSSFQFISIVAIRTGDDVEKFQFLNIVLKKEIGPLFLEAS